MSETKQDQQNKNNKQEIKEVWRYKNAFKKVKETEPDITKQVYDLENNDQFIKNLEDSPEFFLGKFDLGNIYSVQRGYVDGQGTQLRLYTTKFSPLGVKKASVCIVHGFGEHSSRFLHIADYFAKNGFEVHLIDLRGFGYSGGPRGASELEKLHMDVETMIRSASTELPLFLYGHSLGGLVVLTLAMRNPDLNIAGIISTSALLGFPKDRKMSFLKTFFVKSIGKKLEDIVINSMIHPTALTKNNLYIRKCFGDRLMAPFIGLSMAKSILEGTEYAIPNAYKLSKPVLMIHGKLDMVTSHFDSIQFYNKCSSQDQYKELVLFEDGYHELQHDQECQQLKEKVLQWMNKIYKNQKPFGINSSLKLKYGVEKKPKKSLKMPLLCLLILIYFYYMNKFKDHPLFGKKWKFWVISPLIYAYMKVRY